MNKIKIDYYIYVEKCSCGIDVHAIFSECEEEVRLWGIDIHTDFQPSGSFGLPGRANTGAGPSKAFHHSNRWGHLHDNIHIRLPGLGGSRFALFGCWEC